jgi:hypothetical protein
MGMINDDPSAADPFGAIADEFVEGVVAAGPRG